MRAPALVLGTALAAAGACGTEAPPPARTGAPGPLASPAARPGDVVVATVGGRPVWGSCVAAQVARGAGGRRAALDECIDFELLAEAAEARGLADDPEVREAARAALVSRLVETAFEDRYRAPADLAEIVDRVVDRYRDQMDKPELRASAFARIEVPKGAPPEADAAARALAERIAGELAGEAGLFPVHLREAADRLAAAAGLRVTHGDFRAATREGLVPPYAEALYAIPEVGRIAAPARTEWGWDVILLTERMAPRVYTREEIAAEVFPDVRRQYFQLWVNGLARSLGVRVELDAAQIARLDEGGPGR
ncbi:MAG TPA: peptidylprolyl isomerase [Kofleriaceae bacterium]|nr:peptidylprolyl isomerase [Kofleriaceae bacterium]